MKPRDALYRSRLGDMFWHYQDWIESDARRRGEIHPEVADVHDFLVLHARPAAAQPDYPLEKLNRWLGYVQGRMIAAKFTSTDDERERTRPIFKPLDFPGWEPEERVLFTREEKETES